MSVETATAPDNKLTDEKLSANDFIPDFGFEVLKNGQLCGKIQINKPLMKLGRTPENEIESLHPSTSRHHATIEVINSELYITDENSTHGTFLNKKRLPGKTPTRLRVGNFLKIGMSTRSFIVYGPEEDRDKETGKTWSELKAAKERFNRAKKMTPQQLEALMSGEDVNQADKNKDKHQEIANKLQEVTWGFGEDAAVSDNSDDQGEGMDLSNLDTKEKYYHKDPEKALNHFFQAERLGEKEVLAEKVGKNRWRIKIPLPVDSEKTGKQLVGQVEESGNKNDVIRAACLECCKLLDKAGVLSTNSAHKKLITRDWKNNAYYDSDEDEFLDRTEQLQQKRTKRKERLGDLDNVKQKDVTFSYKQVEENLKRIVVRLYEIQQEFDADKKRRKEAEDSSADPLEAFMDHIKKGNAMTTAKRLELRGEMANLKKEQQKFVNLEKAARPNNVKAAPVFKAEDVLKEREEADKREGKIEIEKEKIKEPESVKKATVAQVIKEPVPEKKKKEETNKSKGPIGPLPLAPELARFETANDVKEKKLKEEQEEEAKTERLRKGEFSPYLQAPPVEKRYSTSQVVKLSVN